VAEIYDDFTIEPLGEHERAAIRVAGEIDMASASRLGDHLERLTDQALDGDVQIDAADVTFLDSSGLRVLVGASARLRMNGHRLVVRNPSPPFRRTLDLAGLLDDFLPPPGDG
jgi:anti-sigma B factor antagonist